MDINSKKKLEVLRVEKLSMTVENFSLKDISFSINKGEYFVIMGTTGSGKSLLLKSICGFYDITSGEIIINGKDVAHKEPKDRHIGYVPQDSALFPNYNVLGNIIFSLVNSGIKKDIATDMVKEIVEKLKIDHLLERTVKNLSGGERQKVALARALAFNPDLLILDEPVSALDEPARIEICKTLQIIQEEFQPAIIHVCHNRDETSLLSDNVGIMYDGELVETGKFNELTRTSNNKITKKLLNP